MSQCPARATVLLSVFTGAATVDWDKLLQAQAAVQSDAFNLLAAAARILHSPPLLHSTQGQGCSANGGTYNKQNSGMTS